MWCCLQLWHAYLRERQKAVRGLSVKDPVVSALNNTYERALVSMHKMPRVWLEYLVNVPTWLETKAVNTACSGPEHVGMWYCCATHRAEYLMQEFMVEQGLVTRTRRAFDRALCALPITQHERIWQIYLVSPHQSLTSLRSLFERPGINA